MRVAYVELLMNSEDLHAQPPIHPLASACNYFSEGLQLSMQPVLSAATAEVEAFGGVMGRRRDLAQASVFKIPSLQLQRDHNTRSNQVI